MSQSGGVVPTRDPAPRIGAHCEHINHVVGMHAPVFDTGSSLSGSDLGNEADGPDTWHGGYDTLDGTLQNGPCAFDSGTLWFRDGSWDVANKTLSTDLVILDGHMQKRKVGKRHLAGRWA